MNGTMYIDNMVCFAVTVPLKSSKKTIYYRLFNGRLFFILSTYRHPYAVLPQEFPKISGNILSKDTNSKLCRHA